MRRTALLLGLFVHMVSKFLVLVRHPPHGFQQDGQFMEASLAWNLDVPPAAFVTKREQVIVGKTGEPEEELDALLP